ncbi:MAG: bifunctional folylpolyglutamate synthase/dihydrofolate synthase [Pseudanabaenaceae cyanobacterium]
MSYSQKIASYAKFGIRLSLERIENLLANLGDPHLQVPIVHIAGTNGKGSVCAYLSTVLEQAGYTVGRYISPHLFDWCERITINNHWISTKELEHYLARVEQAINPEYIPTQFELVTAIMWLYFAEQKVDIAVIETGLGGRLDATNVHPQPLVTSITSISRDHWQRLGDSLTQIASEKAGIIKPHCPVVVSELPEPAEIVIKQKAQIQKAPLIKVEPAVLVDSLTNRFTWRSLTFQSSLVGEHQLFNTAIVLGIVELLNQQGWQISAQAVQTGMAETKWLGRLQWYEFAGKRWLLDGAHNVGSAVYLRKFIDQYFPDQPVTWIMGIIATKDAEGIIKTLLRPQDLLLAVPVPDHQSYTPEQLASYAHKLLVNVPAPCASLEQAIALCLAKNYPQPIICGSLYLLGYFLAQQAQPY